MPATVTAWPSSRIVRPTSPRSPAKYLCHAAWVTQVTGAAPTWSSAAVRPRPCATWRSSTEKNSPDTRQVETSSVLSGVFNLAESG